MGRVYFEAREDRTGRLLESGPVLEDVMELAKRDASVNPGLIHEIRRVEVLGHFVCPKPEPQWIPEPDEPAPASPTAHEKPAPDTASEARSRLEEQFRTAGDAQIAAALCTLEAACPGTLVALRDWIMNSARASAAALLQDASARPEVASCYKCSHRNADGRCGKRPWIEQVNAEYVCDDFICWVPPGLPMAPQSEVDAINRALLQGTMGIGQSGVAVPEAAAGTAGTAAAEAMAETCEACARFNLCCLGGMRLTTDVGSDVCRRFSRG